MKFTIKMLFLITIAIQIVYSAQQDNIETIDSKYRQISKKQDTLEQLKILHEKILEINQKTSINLQNQESFEEIFKKIEELRSIELEKATVFISNDYKSMIHEDISHISKIINNMVKISDRFERSSEVLKSNNLFLNIQNYLIKCNSDCVSKDELENKEKLLLGIKSLFFDLKKKEEVIKPSFFEKLFGYNPEMNALRKTLIIVNGKKITQQNIANIFEVSQSTISNFLRGSNSKKLLNNFYRIIKFAEYLENTITSIDNCSTEMKPLLSLKEKKKQ